MNKTQIQTTIASLIGVAAGYAAGQHWLGLDVGQWTTVLTGMAILVPAAWSAVATRAQSLKDTVGGLPQTTVVTDRASAEALPNNPDVVPATPEIVAAIKKVQ